MAKPKLALIPAAQGTSLYSVLPSSGVGDFSFTRSGSATRINSQGLIETVASGVSRLNYPMIDGVVKGCPHHILEPARTNLYRYSEAFTNINNINLNVTDNVEISPKGDLSSSSIIPTTTNTSHYLSFGNNSTGTVTFSIYAKPKGYNYILLHLWDGSNGRAWFDLENGVIGTTDASVSANIEKMPNGWYKCIITRVLSGSLTQVDVLVSENDNVPNFAGNGNDGLYIYGAQLEVGSYSTSYIPNYGTAAGVTRSAETANGSGDAATFNDSEGVLMAETKGENDGTFNYISLSDGGTQNYAGILYTDEDNQITYRYYVGGSGVQLIVDDIIVTNFNKIAIKWKVNDFAFWINGFEVGTASSGSLNPSGTFNELSFARGGNNNTPFYGNTKQIQYFDTALTDIDLEQLTSWVSFQEMAEGQLYSVE